MSVKANNDRIIDQIINEQRALQPEVVNPYPSISDGPAGQNPIDLSPEVGQEAVADTKTWNRDDPPTDDNDVAYAGAEFPFQRMCWDDTLKRLHIFTRLITIDSAGAIYDISEETETVVESEEC